MSARQTKPRYVSIGSSVYDTTISYKPIRIASFEPGGPRTARFGDTDGDALATASAAALNALVSK